MPVAVRQLLLGRIRDVVAPRDIPIRVFAINGVLGDLAVGSSIRDRRSPLQRLPPISRPTGQESEECRYNLVISRP
jgi:hypothetical protein